MLKALQFTLQFACVTWIQGTQATEHDDALLYRLSSDMDLLRQKVSSQDHVIIDLMQTIEKQKELLNEQADTIATLRGALDNTVDEVGTAVARPGARDQAVAKEVYGCILETLQLNCSSGFTILVNSAVYGQYSNSCVGCCEPGDGDCTELMSDNSPPEWTALKLQCDGQSSCSYQYEGAIINDCEVGYVADYMKIDYECTGTIIEPRNNVGFTAYASSTQAYAYQDIVVFDNVLSNLGDAYLPLNSTFVCPYRGVYMISVNFMADTGSYMYIELMRDQTVLLEARADDDSSISTQSSAFIVTECKAGETIWPRTGYDGTDNVMYSEASGLSHFSGYLLYRFA